MHPAAAETLALKALTQLAGEPETLRRFLDLSGLRLDELRARAAEPELLAAVLDFTLGNEPTLIAFLAAEGINASVVHAARAALPGAAFET